MAWSELLEETFRKGIAQERDTEDDTEDDTEETHKSPMTCRRPCCVEGNQVTREEFKFLLALQARMFSPTRIREAFKEKYGKDVTLAYLYTIHPRDGAHSEAQAHRHWKKKHEQDLMQYYKEERERYVKALEEQPLYHKAVRLEALWDIYQKSMATKQYEISLKAVDQAAKETSGTYTRAGAANTRNADVIQKMRGDLENRRQEYVQMMQQREKQSLPTLMRDKAAKNPFLTAQNGLAEA